jgi:16S rRNA (guanine966-N2)-methyltransferase
MRIIAGTAKGRKLFSVSKKMMVKPISDRMKQSLFDIIRPQISGSIFLDLFAGTGNVGLEALSRNAMKVVFAEREVACVKTIQKNLDNLGFTERAKVCKCDILKGVKFLYNHTDEQGFDIIYMGPPYRLADNRELSLTEPVLKDIAKNELLANGGTIICQHHQNEEFKIPKNLELYRTEKYGDTRIDFLKYSKESK